MNTTQLRDFIKEVNFFAGLNPQDIDDLITICQIQNFVENDVLIQEGDESNKDLYIIFSGSVVANISTQKEDSANINVMERGQIFGELSLISDIKRSASIIATSSGTVIRISKQNFEKICQQNPHLGMITYKNIAHVLSDRIRNTNKMLKHTILWGW